PEHFAATNPTGRCAGNCDRGRTPSAGAPLSGRRDRSTAAASGRFARLGLLVESLRSDVCTVRPRHGPPIQEEALEVPSVLERLEDWTLQPLREVDCLFDTIVEPEMDLVLPAVLRSGDKRQKPHGTSSVERRDPLQRLTCLHATPVGFQLLAV